MYTASLNKNPFDSVVWSNRAAVRLKLEEHGLGKLGPAEAPSAPRCERLLTRRLCAPLSPLQPLPTRPGRLS